MLLPPRKQPQKVRDGAVVYSVSKGMVVAKDGKEALFTVGMAPEAVLLTKHIEENKTDQIILALIKLTFSWLNLFPVLLRYI